MKHFSNITFFISSFIILLGVWACTDMYEYEKYAPQTETAYTGRIDSLSVFAGKNRVMIMGPLNADPKISEMRVFWNSGEDSISIPIDRSTGIDTVEHIIEDLPENTYNFEVITYDDLGNPSVSVYQTGNVYGDRYQSSLTNRPIVSQILIGTNLTVNYAGMDRTSGVQGTEIMYTTSEGSDSTVFVPIDSTSVLIDNFQTGSTYQYRTVFLPEERAIDEFYTEYVSQTPVMQISEAPYLENASYPYEIGDDSGGRWNTPADWIHNEAALSHNGYGALDGDLFDLESGWGQPDIINGKVYQNVVLDPGTYIYSIDIRETNYEGDDNDLDNGYFTVSKGASLPDVANVETSEAVLGWEQVHKSNLNPSILFTVDEVSQISIGVQTTNDKGQGRYLKIDSFTLGKIAEAPYLQNASAPFDRLDPENSGRWATPADWQHNESILNHNGYGGIDGDIFNIETGWGESDIVNGKIWQTLFLAPGTYTYDINITESNYEGDDNNLDNAYFTVAMGTTLPDVADVETAGEVLVYEQVHKNNLSPSLTFTITEISQVSIGVETTNDQGAGRYLKINSFELNSQ